MNFIFPLLEQDSGMDESNFKEMRNNFFNKNDFE